MSEGKYRIRRKKASTADHTISAAEFKARCLELMDHVSETGVEYVVTKHRRPVAKLVRCGAAEPKPLFGALSGTVLKYERPFESIEGEWDVNNG
jgi:prevent-host-death family protein